MDPRYARLGAKQNRQAVGVRDITSTLRDAARPMHRLCGFDADCGKERQPVAMSGKENVTIRITPSFSRRPNVVGPFHFG
jgi:hypothetical protein